jgi:hypothetical protein
MAQSPALVVLAAGIGSRYGGLKQMDPMGPAGEVILDYSVFDALRAGFGRIVFVIRRDIEEDFRRLLGKRFERRAEVRYAMQGLDSLPAGYSAPAGRSKPWGTGHAALCAAGAVDGPFAVINADDFYGAESFRVLADFLANPAPAADGRDSFAMVGFRLDRTLSENGTVSRGVCTTDTDGFLVSVEELTAIGRTGNGICNREADGSSRPLRGDMPVSMNYWGFTPPAFAHLGRLFAEFLDAHGRDLKKEFYLPAAVDSLVREGKVRVKVIPTTASWFGITHREDKPLVMEAIRSLVQSGAYPDPLWR